MACFYFPRVKEYVDGLCFSVDSNPKPSVGCPVGEEGLAEAQFIRTSLVRPSIAWEKVLRNYSLRLRILVEQCDERRTVDPMSLDLPLG